MYEITGELNNHNKNIMTEMLDCVLKFFECSIFVKKERTETFFRYFFEGVVSKLNLI